MTLLTATASRPPTRTANAQTKRPCMPLADDKVELWLDLSRESPLDQDLLLDIKEFAVRPMDRSMNNARQKDLAAIDPQTKAG